MSFGAARRIGATAIDALFFVAPWAALVGLMVHHGVWSGLAGGLGDGIVVVFGCAGASALVVTLDLVIWLAKGRTVGMGLARLAVSRGRPWLASVIVIALAGAVGGAAYAAAIAAGSVNPQNAVALALIATKGVDLAFGMGASGRTLVDRLSDLQVALVPRSPRRAVPSGKAIDAALAVAFAAPLLLEISDFDRLAGAVMGTGATLLALLVLQAVTFTVTGRTLGMHVLSDSSEVER